MKVVLKKILPYIVGAVLLAAAIYGCVQLVMPTLEFKSIQARATVETFAEDIDPLKGALDHKVWAHYTDISTDAELNALLLRNLQESKTAEDFINAFAAPVEEHYWQGYKLHLGVKTDLGGSRGTITVTGDHIPKALYAILTTYTSDKAEERIVLPVVNGAGYYNLYGKDVSKTSLFLAADKAGEQVLSATHTENISPLYLPEVLISELSNEHTATYYSDLENGGKQHKGSYEQTFQYIELYNYGERSVDLKEYTFIYTDQVGEHRFEWLTESDGALILEPKKTFVIGVYAADTARAGLTYESDEGKKEYWQAFNAFYNTEIPVGQRVMIACVASGKSEEKLDGIDHLERSANAGVTVTAELRRGGSSITKVSLPDDKPHNSYAYQFLPAKVGESEQTFLFTSGCFPGALLTEQDLYHCETPDPEDSRLIKAVSYNILATDDNPGEKQGPVKYRSNLFFRFMEEYQPDIIGLQEVNYRWAPLLQEQMAALGYGEVQGISSENHTYENINTRNEWDLMNPIYYSLERYELLESGDAFLTIDGTIDTVQWDSVNLKRTMTWVVLKDKESGDVVTHLNTHLILSGKAGRVEQVKAICDKGEALQKKYGGSIIVTGDHNMAEGSEPYQAYLNSGLLTDTKYQTTNHSSVGSFTDFDTAYNELYGAPIDFCFASHDLSVSKYRVFGGRYADGIISDHSAILAELYIKK